MTPVHTLTPRQLQVLDALSKHGTQGAVAQGLCISKSRVAQHVQALYRKLGVTNGVRLMVVAFEKGLL